MWKFIILAVFSILWALNASEGFDKVHKPSKTGCNSTIDSKNNSAFDLNFHNLTHPCYWNISGKGLLRLYFLRVFLHETDELTLYKNWTDAVSGINPLMPKPIPSQNGTITVVTNEELVVVKLVGGQDPLYQRIFEGYFSVDACSLPVPPDVETLYAPTYLEDVSKVVECLYHFNEIPHKRVKQVFTFEEFNMSSSEVTIEDGTIGEYKNGMATDFFMDVNKKLITIHVKQAINSTDYFKLKIHEVDSKCSGKFEFSEDLKAFKSPKPELNNGSIVYECRWLITHSNSKNILGVKLNDVDFHSVFDIAAVNDGSSENSTPLFQVTTSNKNITKNQKIRSTGSSLWVSFKPLGYESRFDFNITVHGQGGYFKDSGNIEMKSTTGDDTVFLLEVDSNEVVMLTFDSSSITPPATVSVYDGFSTDNLLTTIHRDVKFPILSRSSRIMVTGTNFSAPSNHFTAHFKGVLPRCNHMSSSGTESFILSEYCNSTCAWIIPPEDVPNAELIVSLQYVSLKVGEYIKIYRLDADLTELAEVTSNKTHVPHIAIPTNVGVMINVTLSECVKPTDRIVLVGHSSYIPDCNHNIITRPSESLQISSPLYPDTYPVFSSCLWNITAPKDNIVHMAFENLNLAENHCIKISEESGQPNKFEGKTLPSDLFLAGNVRIDFDSLACNKSEVGKTLNSDSGFLLNVTVTDCGAVLDNKKSGEFNTSVSGNKSVCIWKVTVPPKDGSSVNVISYVVNKKDSLQNYELHVYDGSTVRDAKIENNTDSEIWSRTNTLIFIYKRLNVSQPSSLLVFKFKTIGCNTSMQCANNLCMHPDWRCNGKNDCGDYSDEHNCASVPIPPEVKFTGYSATAFWLCTLAMILIGIILGVTVPVCYQKYKDSRYRQFHELET